MALSLGSRIGPYELVAPLGAGGMTEVYKPRDSRLQLEVALEVVTELFARDLERLARFEREAQVLASLNHPHIAHIHGIEESHSTRALVVGLVDSPTLADRMASGPVPLDDALAIARQIAQSLEGAHEPGIETRRRSAAGAFARRSMRSPTFKRIGKQ